MKGRFVRACFAIAWSVAVASTAGNVAVAATRASDASVPVIYAFEQYQSTVYANDARTGRRIEVLKGFAGQVNALAAGPNGNLYVASVDQANNVWIYVFKPGATSPFQTFVDGTGYFAIIAVSQAGELAVVRDDVQFQRMLDVYAPGATKPLRSFGTSWDAIFNVAYAPGGALWLNGFDPSVKNGFGYVPPGGSTIVEVPFQSSPMYGALAVAPDGSILNAGSGEIDAYSQGGALLHRTFFELRPSVSSFGLSPDGTTIYVGSSDLQIEEFRYPAGGRPVRAFGPHASALAVGKLPH